MIVDVYWNRRIRPRAWSVREGGRVSRHARAIALMDVRFVVHEGAVARVQRLRQRAVCAYAGASRATRPRYPAAVRVVFNPFEAAAFTTEDGVAVLRLPCSLPRRWIMLGRAVALAWCSPVPRPSRRPRIRRRTCPTTARGPRSLGRATGGSMQSGRPPSW